MSVERICDQPKFKEELERIAAEQKRPLDDVLEEAKNCISELYADQNPLANIATFKGFEYMLSRAYEDTIDVDPQEVKRLMKLMRKKFCCFYSHSQNLFGYCCLNSYPLPLWHACSLLFWRH